MTLLWLLISTSIDWFSVEQLEDFKHEQNVSDSNGLFPLFAAAACFCPSFPPFPPITEDSSSMSNKFVPRQEETAKTDSFGQVWSMKWSPRHHLESAFTREKHQVFSQISEQCEVWMCSGYVCVSVSPTYQLHFYTQPGLIRKYGKGSRAVKSSLLTFSSLHKSEMKSEVSRRWRWRPTLSRREGHL